MAGSWQRKPPFQTYSRTVNQGSGAKAGLEAKMRYWADRDFRTEFSITLGQARNNTVRTGDVEKDLELLLEEFSFMLKAKNDPRFHEPFQRYYKEAKSFQGIVMEDEEQKAIDASPPDQIPIINMDEEAITHSTSPAKPMPGNVIIP